MQLPAGDVPEPFLDVEDIADIAFAALTEAGHAGRLYELTGPRLLTFPEAVSEIAEAADRPIEFTEVPQDAYRAALSDAGLPDEIVWLVDYLFRTVLDGRNAYVADGVQQALGRAPRDFAAYARTVAATGVWNRSDGRAAR